MFAATNEPAEFVLNNPISPIVKVAEFALPSKDAVARAVPVATVDGDTVTNEFSLEVRSVQLATMLVVPLPMAM